MAPLFRVTHKHTAQYTQSHYHTRTESLEHWDDDDYFMSLVSQDAGCECDAGPGRLEMGGMEWMLENWAGCNRDECRMMGYSFKSLSLYPYSRHIIGNQERIKRNLPREVLLQDESLNITELRVGW